MWMECISCNCIFSNNAGTLVRRIQMNLFSGFHPVLESESTPESTLTNSSNRRANNLVHRTFPQMVLVNSHTFQSHPSYDNQVCIRFAYITCAERNRFKSIFVNYSTSTTYLSKPVSSEKKHGRKCGSYGRMSSDPDTTKASKDM